MTIIFFLYGLSNKDIDVMGLALCGLVGIACDAFILALLALVNSISG